MKFSRDPSVALEERRSLMLQLISLEGNGQLTIKASKPINQRVPGHSVPDEPQMRGHDVPCALSLLGPPMCISLSLLFGISLAPHVMSRGDKNVLITLMGSDSGCMPPPWNLAGFT